MSAFLNENIQQIGDILDPFDFLEAKIIESTELDMTVLCNEQVRPPF